MALLPSVPLPFLLIQPCSPLLKLRKKILIHRRTVILFTFIQKVCERIGDRRLINLRELKNATTVKKDGDVPTEYDILVLFTADEVERMWVIAATRARLALDRYADENDCQKGEANTKLKFFELDKNEGSFEPLECNMDVFLWVWIVIVQIGSGIGMTEIVTRAGHNLRESVPPPRALQKMSLPSFGNPTLAELLSTRDAREDEPATPRSLRSRDNSKDHLERCGGSIGKPVYEPTTDSREMLTAYYKYCMCLYLHAVNVNFAKSRGRTRTAQWNLQELVAGAIRVSPSDEAIMKEFKVLQEPPVEEFVEDGDRLRSSLLPLTAFFYLTDKMSAPLLNSIFLFDVKASATGGSTTLREIWPRILEAICWSPCHVINIIAIQDSIVQPSFAGKELLGAVNEARLEFGRKPLVRLNSDGESPPNSSKRCDVKRSVGLGSVPWYGILSHSRQGLTVLPRDSEIKSSLDRGKRSVASRGWTASFVLNHVSNGAFIIEDSVSDLLIANCTNATITVPVVSGQVMLRDCMRCHVTVSSHQVTMINCLDVTLSLLSSTKAVVSNTCQRCFLGPMGYWHAGLALVLHNKVGMTFSDKNVELFKKCYLLGDHRNTDGDSQKAKAVQLLPPSSFRPMIKGGEGDASEFRLPQQYLREVWSQARNRCLSLGVLHLAQWKAKIEGEGTLQISSRTEAEFLRWLNLHGQKHMLHGDSDQLINIEAFKT